MNATKQLLFMSRVLFLHRVASARAGKSAMVRLSLDKWAEECDRVCFLGFVREEMENAHCSDGSKMFDAALLDTVTKRIIEGFRW